MDKTGILGMSFERKDLLLEEFKYLSQSLEKHSSFLFAAVPILITVSMTMLIAVGDKNFKYLGTSIAFGLLFLFMSWAYSQCFMMHKSIHLVWLEHEINFECNSNLISASEDKIYPEFRKKTGLNYNTIIQAECVNKVTGHSVLLVLVVAFFLIIFICSLVKMGFELYAYHFKNMHLGFVLSIVFPLLPFIFFLLSGLTIKKAEKCALKAKHKIVIDFDKRRKESTNSTST